MIEFLKILVFGVWEISGLFAKWPGSLEQVCERELSDLISRFDLKVVSRYHEYDGEQVTLGNSTTHVSFSFELGHLSAEIVSSRANPIQHGIVGFLSVVLDTEGKKVARKLASPVHRRKVGPRIRLIGELMQKHCAEELRGNFSRPVLGKIDQLWDTLASAFWYPHLSE